VADRATELDPRDDMSQSPAIQLRSESGTEMTPAISILMIVVTDAHPIADALPIDHIKVPKDSFDTERWSDGATSRPNC
jgi:hypothetical protein